MSVFTLLCVKIRNSVTEIESATADFLTLVDCLSIVTAGNVNSIRNSDRRRLSYGDCEVPQVQSGDFRHNGG